MKSTATWIATSGYALLAMTEAGLFRSKLEREIGGLTAGI